MTDNANRGIILGKDGLLGFPYEKRGRFHRLVLFEIRGTDIVLRHPVSKADVIIGQVSIQDEKIVCIFPLSHEPP